MLRADRTTDVTMATPRKSAFIAVVGPRSTIDAQRSTTRGGIVVPNTEAIALGFGAGRARARAARAGGRKRAVRSRETRAR